MTTITTDVRRGSGEIALWWIGVMVLGWSCPGLGLVLGVVAAATRMRAHRVQRVALPVVGAVVSVVAVLGAVVATTTGEVTDAGVAVAGGSR